MGIVCILCKSVCVYLCASALDHDSTLITAQLLFWHLICLRAPWHNSAPLYRGVSAGATGKEHSGGFTFVLKLSLLPPSLWRSFRMYLLKAVQKTQTKKRLFIPQPNVVILPSSSSTQSTLCREFHFTAGSSPGVSSEVGARLHGRLSL